MKPATVPICEACWQAEEPGRPEPVRLVETEREIEVCYRCDRYTLSGIYVRRMIPTDERT